MSIIWNVSGGFVFRDELMEITKHNNNIIPYDSCKGLLWNGGRVLSNRNKEDVNNFISVIQQFNRQGIGFNIAFNNVCISGKYLNDKKCNAILKACHNDINGIIIGTNLLRDYIHKKYKKYRLIASLCHNSPKKYLFENYDIVTLNPDLNRNYEFFDMLSKEQIEKAEILVNEYCHVNCPKRYAHYEILSTNILNKNNQKDMCVYMPQNGTKGQLILSADEIDKLKAMGIKHFKIQGRQEKEFDVIEKSINRFILNK